MAKVQSEKRTDYLSWDEYFMAIAFLSAERSKDPVTQVGACIVTEDKKIVAIGYNGMPNGCSDDVLPWGKGSDNPLENKTLYVCHAEMNAIMNRNESTLKGCTLYVALFPCNECAKLIIQAGISKIYYFSNKKHDSVSVQASRILLDLAGVIYIQLIPKRKVIEINFEKINST
ncbi:Deoxycytidylate deaminase [Oopsacas minuta]|uniref:dCMP deaminase n=1 Tax=Oopsacas minuta TaxID=111878 RepID=A0AAV7JUT3_9METZ|nr:Deoxycytidylate deaminase [Oopsacas minuta]